MKQGIEQACKREREREREREKRRKRERERKEGRKTEGEKVKEGAREVGTSEGESKRRGEECKRRGMQIRNAWAESRRKRARVAWEDREGGTGWKGVYKRW